MTKTRTIIGLFIAMLMIAISGFIFKISVSPTVASAETETTGVYTLTFDYEYYRVYSFAYGGNFPYDLENWTDGSHRYLETGTDTSVQIMDGTGFSDFYINIYGEVPNPAVTKTLDKNEYVNFKTVNIKVPALCQGASAGVLSHDYRYRITQLSNSSGTLLVNDKIYPKSSDPGSEILYSGSLPDGTYTLHLEYSNYKTEWIYYHRITTTFKVDKTAPTISGASLSPTGKFTNTSFQVTASDSGSGISKIYYMSPTSTSYQSVNGSSVSISKQSASGQYKFYAVDKCGNESSVYYVNFDCVPPQLECVGANFGESTNGSFIVTATDYAGDVTLYYKKNSGNWIASGNRFVSGRETVDTTYYFYAIDSYGNKSSEVWVKSVLLYGEFIKSDTDNSVYFTWEHASWTATLDGNSYNRGDWIRKEGKHTIILSSDSNTALYSYTIDHYYVEIFSQADCTHSGYVEYECAQCGDSYVKEFSEELGHYYVASTVAPTCTSGGYTTYTCTRCGDNYRDSETPKLGHNYVQTQVSSTCTGSGYMLYSCTRCSYEYRSGSTQPTGHSYVETTYPATCTEGSYTLHKCSICGSSYKDNESQPLGHNFVTYSEPPTCTEYGKSVSSCQVCGYEESKSDGTYPTGHSYTSEIIKPAGCTEKGLRLTNCDVCGEHYESEISAHGHSYEITETRSSGGITSRTYTCSTCGDSYTQELGDQYEQVTSYVEYLFKQYSPYMIWVFLATAGLWSIAIGVALIIARKNEDKEKAKKMLINYAIGLVVIFVILVACPYLVRGIALLVA